MAKTKKYTPKQLEQLGAVLAEPDATKRWRLIADFAREANPHVKKEQDIQSKACKEIREAKLYRSSRKKGQIRFTVSIPPLTYEAMVAVDPELIHLNKEDYYSPSATNKQAKDLARVFPEYRVS